MEKEEKKEEVQEEKVEPKKGPKKTGVILCIFVIVLLIVAIFALLFSKRGENTTKKIKNNSKDYYSEYRMSGNSLEDFDLYFLQLENQKKNTIYSPLSIKYALEMLAEGAKGDTKAQLDAVIGDYKANKYPNNEHMSFANAMFIRNTFKDSVLDSYTKTLTDKYGAEVIYDSFDNANTINSWVDEKTLHLIKNLVKDDSVQSAQYYLVNALAIDMQWNNLIQCEAGSRLTACLRYHVNYAHEKYGDYVSVIYGESGYHGLEFDGKQNIKSLEIAASFNNYDIVKELGEDSIRKTVGDAYRDWLENDEDLKKSREYGYEPEEDVDKYLDQYIKEIDSNYGSEDTSSDYSLYVDDDVKVFAKDLQTYEGKTLQYVGIMPKEKELQEFVKNTDSKTISKYIKNLKELKKENFKKGVVTQITGYIPVFEYEYELDLMNDLKALGIEDVFDSEKSDLTNMTKTKGSYIFEAGHKANIEFSNEGIRAAAATYMGGDGETSGGFDYLYDVPVEVIDITFDHPYLYLVRDKDTGEVWFVGTVYEPTVRSVEG